MKQTDLRGVQDISHRVDLHIGIMEERDVGLAGHEPQSLLLPAENVHELAHPSLE
jgi:hypothetical protein